MLKKPSARPQASRNGRGGWEGDVNEMMRVVQRRGEEVIGAMRGRWERAYKGGGEMVRRERMCEWGQRGECGEGSGGACAVRGSGCCKVLCTGTVANAVSRSAHDGAHWSALDVRRDPLRREGELARRFSRREHLDQLRVASTRRSGAWLTEGARYGTQHSELGKICASSVSSWQSRGTGKVGLGGD